MSTALVEVDLRHALVGGVALTNGQLRVPRAVPVSSSRQVPAARFGDRLLELANTINRSKKFGPPVSATLARAETLPFTA